MRSWIRSHLTFANIASLTAVFIALGGTAAGAVIITSNGQVAQNTISGHSALAGKHPNIIAGTVNSQDVTDNSLDGSDIKDNSLGGPDVADNSLTGADIADRSGVDTCQSPLVKKFGPICAGSDAGARDWGTALGYCAGLGLRLPSLPEALALAAKYDVPGVSDAQRYWTDEEIYSNGFRAEYATEHAGFSTIPESDTAQTVCVTDPSA